MSESQNLMSRIAALRQRLEQAQGLIQEAGSAAVSLLDSDNEGIARLWEVEQRVEQGRDNSRVMEHELWRVDRAHGRAAPEILPEQLTARARRGLERGRELLAVVRELASDPLTQERGNPLAILHREATYLLDTTVRMVQLFPSNPSGQLKLCEGMEVTLNDVTHRINKLKALLAQQHQLQHRISDLAELLQKLERGECTDSKRFTRMADALLNEADQCAPFHIFHPVATSEPDKKYVADCVARHSLVVAQVIARIVRHEPDLRQRASEVVVAALIHDVGMLRVDPQILAKTEKLTLEERREVEAHTRHGAELVKELLPDAHWLHEAVLHHHERLSGTGYPHGVRELQLSSLTRLLAVCDVYAACCASRPHRRAHETRTALTETLLMAEQGVLDRKHAERLLQMSFYPVGAVVELADGTCGVVLATPVGRTELNAPARPVIALLTDTQGGLLPVMRPLDLVECENRSIVRTLTSKEKQRLLCELYPEWALEN